MLPCVSLSAGATGLHPTMAKVHDNSDSAWTHGQYFLRGCSPLVFQPTLVFMMYLLIAEFSVVLGRFLLQQYKHCWFAIG